MEYKESNSAPFSQLGDTKSRFLDSIGLGEDSLRELARSGRIREREDKVVLSSQAGEMELPEAPNNNMSIRARSSIEVKDMASAAGHAQFARPVAEVEKPVQDKVNDSEATSESEPVLKLTESEVDLMGERSVSENLLQVYCPKCDGELVIQQKHVGIEGTCVWCDAAIIASLSSSNGEIKIYPVFRPGEAFEKKEPIVEQGPLPKDRQAVLEDAFADGAAPAPFPAIESALKGRLFADSDNHVSPTSEADIASAVGFKSDKPAVVMGTNTSSEVSEGKTPDFEAIFKSIPRFESPHPISARTGPSPESSPAVTSKSRRTELKKPLRKSFIATIIVILGFVSGAAFATFVLPIDEYLAEARDSMNKEADDASPEDSGYAPIPAAGTTTSIPGYTPPLPQP